MKNFSLHKLIIVLFGLFPILPNRIKGLPVILFALVSLYDFFQTKDSFKKSFIKLNWKYSVLLSSTYLLYLISIINSNNLEVAGKKLEIGLSILIIPLFLLISRGKWLKEDYTTLFKWTYTYALSLFSIIYFIFSFFYENKFYPKGFFITSFMRKTITEIPLIETHPIYASVFLGIGIIILISLYKKISLIIFTLLFFLFTTHIIVLASKMVIISLVIITLLFLLRIIYSKKVKLISTSIIMTLFIVSYLFVPSINARFKELFQDKTYEKVDIHNSSSIRYAISKCSLSLVKDAGLFGYGIGEVQDNLDACYRGTSEHLLKKRYNSHSQYISIWLGTGIIGLLTFLFMLAYNFKLAWHNNDLLFISILIFFLINFLTENLLERQSGVILFAFLINFFGWHDYLKKNEI